MLENLAWEMFKLTGNIDEYLLYKNAEQEVASEHTVAEKISEKKDGTY